MNKQELKDWFFSDCKSMLSYWTEAEKTFSGTNTLEQYVLERNIPIQGAWAEAERADGFPFKDQWLEANLQEVHSNSQDFDAGTTSILDTRGRFFRFVYLDGEYYTCCEFYGVLSLLQAYTLKMNVSPKLVNNVNRFIRHNWRFNSEV